MKRKILITLLYLSICLTLFSQASIIGVLKVTNAAKTDTFFIKPLADSSLIYMNWDKKPISLKGRIYILDSLRLSDGTWIRNNSDLGKTYYGDDGLYLDGDTFKLGDDTLTTSIRLAFIPDTFWGLSLQNNSIVFGQQTYGGTYILLDRDNAALDMYAQKKYNPKGYSRLYIDTVQFTFNNTNGLSSPREVVGDIFNDTSEWGIRSIKRGGFANILGSADYNNETWIDLQLKRNNKEIRLRLDTTGLYYYDGYIPIASNWTDDYFVTKGYVDNIYLRKDTINSLLYNSGIVGAWINSSILSSVDSGNTWMKEEIVNYLYGDPLCFYQAINGDIFYTTAYGYVVNWSKDTADKVSDYPIRAFTQNLIDDKQFALGDDEGDIYTKYDNSAWNTTYGTGDVVNKLLYNSDEDLLIFSDAGIYLGSTPILEEYYFESAIDSGNGTYITSNASGNFYRSFDNGNNWEQVNPTGFSGEPNPSFLIKGKNGRIIICDKNEGKIYYSDDGLVTVTNATGETSSAFYTGCYLGEEVIVIGNQDGNVDVSIDNGETYNNIETIRPWENSSFTSLIAVRSRIDKKLPGNGISITNYKISLDTTIVFRSNSQTPFSIKRSGFIPDFSDYDSSMFIIYPGSISLSSMSPGTTVCSIGIDGMSRTNNYAAFANVFTVPYPTFDTTFMIGHDSASVFIPFIYKTHPVYTTQDSDKIMIDQKRAKDLILGHLEANFDSVKMNKAYFDHKDSVGLGGTATLDLKGHNLFVVTPTSPLTLNYQHASIGTYLIEINQGATGYAVSLSTGGKWIAKDGVQPNITATNNAKTLLNCYYNGYKMIVVSIDNLLNL